MPKYIVVMGGTGSGKDEFIKILNHEIHTINSFSENISIIDFAKVIKNSFLINDDDPEHRSVKSRKMLAGIKDAFDECGGVEGGSCDILLNKIKQSEKNYPDINYYILTIREPKDAIYIKKELDAIIVFVNRDVEHNNKIRAELIPKENLIDIADYIIKNNKDLIHLRKLTENFLNILIQN